MVDHLYVHLILDLNLSLSKILFTWLIREPLMIIKFIITNGQWF